VLQPSTPRGDLRGYELAGLGMTAAATLGFEVFLTRLLAYTVPALLIYMVLGVAMTGFGAASSVIALRARRVDVPGSMSRWAAAFSVLLVVACALFVRLAPALAATPTLAFVGAFLLTAPFFAAGTVITLALSSAGPNVRRVYAVDLLGSGLGCLLPFLLLHSLGASGFIGVISLLGASASMLLARTDRASPLQGAKRFAAPAGGAVAAVVALAWGSAVFPIAAEPAGQVAIMKRAEAPLGYEMVRTFDRWNVTGRVEHFAFHHVRGGPDPYPFGFYAQDNTAGALVAAWDGRDSALAPPEHSGDSVVAPMCSDTLYGQGYYVHRKRVLVIGVGGAADVQCALYHRSEQVDAVEINPDTLAAIKGPLNSLLGGVGTNPRVNYHLRDGRSFVHAARPGTYDLVQLSGVDTKQMLASGALAMNENLLYTREAFIDYFTRLTPHGALSVIYFFEPAALRLVSSMIGALRSIGVEHPEQHLLVAQNTLAYSVIATRSPLDAAALAAYHKRFWFDDRPFRGFHARFLDPFGYAADQRPTLLYTPLQHESPVFTRLIALASSGHATDFERDYPANVQPVSDDRPYFFDTTRYDRPGAMLAPHQAVLRDTLWSILVLAALFVLAPVWRIGRNLGAITAATACAYFASVGLAFLFVEVWLLHRFAMFLGHQTLSMGIVLATLLLATGAGSVSGRMLAQRPPRRILLGVTALLVLLGLDFCALPVVFDLAWHLPLLPRAIIAIVSIVPLGLTMGVFFPAGLEWLGTRHETALPWAVGVNFFASVGATVAAVPLALFGGYTVILAVGMFFYATAALAALCMRYTA
jgi:hypothetical protein